MKTSVTIAAVFCLICLSTANKRVLVLLQDSSEDAKSSYSILFDSLAAYGFSLDIKGHKDPTLKLKNYDNWLYDHLLILAPKADGG